MIGQAISHYRILEKPGAGGWVSPRGLGRFGRELVALQRSLSFYTVKSGAPAATSDGVQAERPGSGHIGDTPRTLSAI